MQRVADEAVLLDLDRASYFGLDPVGTLIWEGLAESKSEPEIVESLTRSFDVEEEVARRDVKAFLIKLQDDKLVRLEEV